MDQEELYEKCLRKNLTNIQKHLDVRNLLSHLYEDCLQPSDKVRFWVFIEDFMEILFELLHFFLNISLF